MQETLMTTLSFLFAIALLIAVHEYGHFIAARKLGVRVEKFSIGFGPKLISWRGRDGEVEYIIALIPLGGYVKMLGENPNDDTAIDEADQGRAFNTQPIWKRASIAFAGPLFNFFFAIIAFMAIGWLGQSVMPTIVGATSPNSIAASAGLMPEDKILAVNGRQVRGWNEFEMQLKERTGQEVSITLLRGGGEVEISLQLSKPEKDPLLVDISGEILGVHPGIQLFVASIVDDSPAAKAGLMTGDQLLKISDVPIISTRDFIEYIRDHADQPLDIEIQRGHKVKTLSITPKIHADSGFGRIGAGLEARALHQPVISNMSFGEGLLYGFTRTWEMTSLTLQVFTKMISATISPDNLGGPIAIAQMTGRAAELGLVAFLSILALISVNLGVLNLLPIPVLDGGLLLFLGLEKLRGKPLTTHTMERIQMIGIMLIVSLMVFAFYNDIIRLIRG
ncbi:MAG: RIP metalloprotease RseP [Mariprofundaceae bacterium]